jgi:hypothetical protein
MQTKTKFLPGILAVCALTLACIFQESPPITEAIPPMNGSITDTVHPAATNTPEPGEPCNNVLFPLTPGRQWIYQKMSVGDATATPDPLTSKFGVTVAQVSGSRAVLNAVDLATGAITETTVDCQDGAILNFPLMTLGSLFGNYLAGDVSITYVSGIFAPSEADLTAANWDMQWQGEYIAAGTITFSSEGEQTVLILENSPISTTWQNAGQETITILAGTFEQAYKIERTTQVEVSISFEGLVGAGTLGFETTHWFAPHIGLLKTEITSATLSLFGVTFPIETTGSVELTETH